MNSKSRIKNRVPRRKTLKIAKVLHLRLKEVAKVRVLINKLKKDKFKHKKMIHTFKLKEINTIL